MKPSDHADLEETLRALEILRERKANSDHYGRIDRTISIGIAFVLAVPAALIALLVFGGILQGEISVWLIVVGVLIVLLPFFVMRAMFPRNTTMSGVMLRQFGYRKPDREILDEQIADYEQRLEFLRGQESN